MFSFAASRPQGSPGWCPPGRCPPARQTVPTHSLGAVWARGQCGDESSGAPMWVLPSCAVTWGWGVLKGLCGQERGLTSAEKVAALPRCPWVSKRERCLAGRAHDYINKPRDPASWACPSVCPSVTGTACHPNLSRSQMKEDGGGWASACNAGRSHSP